MILTTFAVQPLYKAYTLSIDEEHCSPYVRCLEYDILYQQPSPTGEIIDLQGNMTFKSTFVFAVDNPIRYDFSFESKSPELIKNVYFIIVSGKDNFTDVYSKAPLDVIEDAKQHEKLIEVLKQSDNTFKRKALWSYPFEEGVGFVGIVIDIHNGAFFIPKTQALIDLKGIESYFDILDSFNSRANNLIILGLTWAGISAIFILLGGDVLLRIHLRESEVDKWFIDKSKFDLEPI